MNNTASCVVGRAPVGAALPHNERRFSEPSGPMGRAPHLPLARELADDDIRWKLSMMSCWPSAAPVVALAIEALPAIEDDLAARLVERLALTVVDLLEELRATRALLSGALTQLHQHELLIGQLRRDQIELREARRAKGKSA
jgi:hypothetical protein